MDKKDITINRLPVTRKALFKDILKNRWRVLLGCSLLFVLFLIPLLVSSFFKDYFLINLYSNPAYYDSNVLLEAGILKLRSINAMFLIFNSLSILIIFIYLSGFFRILRQLVWSEGISFWYDFKKGIKQNGLAFLKYGLLVVLYYVTIYSLIYFASNPALAVVALVIISLFFMPLTVLGMYYSSIYDASLLQRMRNVLILYIKNLVFCLLISILLESVFLLGLIPFLYVISKQGIILLVCFFVLPIILLLGSLVTIYIFDKDINNHIHPDIYRKGLY